MDSCAQEAVILEYYMLLQQYLCRNAAHCAIYLVLHVRCHLLVLQEEGKEGLHQLRTQRGRHFVRVSAAPSGRNICIQPAVDTHFWTGAGAIQGAIRVAAVTLPHLENARLEVGVLPNEATEEGLMQPLLVLHLEGVEGQCQQRAQRVPQFVKVGTALSGPTAVTQPAGGATASTSCRGSFVVAAASVAAWRERVWSVGTAHDRCSCWVHGQRLEQRLVLGRPLPDSTLGNQGRGHMDYRLKKRSLKDAAIMEGDSGPEPHKRLYFQAVTLPHFVNALPKVSVLTFEATEEGVRHLLLVPQQERDWGLRQRITHSLFVRLAASPTLPSYVIQHSVGAVGRFATAAALCAARSGRVWTVNTAYDLLAGRTGSPLMLILLLFPLRLLVFCLLLLPRAWGGAGSSRQQREDTLGIGGATW